MLDREVDNGMTRCIHGGLCDCCRQCYDYDFEIMEEDEDAIIDRFSENE